MRSASVFAPNLLKILTFDVRLSAFPNQCNITEASPVALQKLEGPEEKHPQYIICLAEG